MQTENGKSVITYFKVIYRIVEYKATTKSLGLAMEKAERLIRKRKHYDR